MIKITARHLGGHERGRPHVTKVINEEISPLAPFAGIILTALLIIFFLVRYYILEGFLLNRCYGNIYLRLNENQRRGFVNHHIAAATKIIMLCSAAYPFCAVIAGKATLQTPYGNSDIATMGDVLIVVNQVFVAMYAFELTYRAKLSPVAVAHHIGAISIAAIAVAISLGWKHQRDATLEFILCLFWGLFDIIAEFWPHVAIILYRMYPKDHDYLRKIFLAAGIVTFAGTIIETVVVMYFWGWAWDRWTLTFKVLTPILHVIFSAAQLWGAWNFYKMWQKQRRLIRQNCALEELALSHSADAAKA